MPSIAAITLTTMTSISRIGVNPVASEGGVADAEGEEEPFARTVGEVAMMQRQNANGGPVSPVED
jgi:hypothetical protein